MANMTTTGTRREETAEKRKKHVRFYGGGFSGENNTNKI